jgi:superkiller protein 3
VGSETQQGEESALQEDDVLSRSQWFTEFDGDSAFDRAVQQYRKRRYRKAQELFRALLDHHSGHPYIEFYVGLCAYKRDDPGEALDWFRRSLRQAPNFPSAHAFRGLAYRSMHRYENAIRSLRSSVSIDSNYAFGLYHLGSTLNEMELPDSALPVLERALEQSPTGMKAFVYNQLGEAYASQNRIDDAEHAYRKAIEYKPRYLKARLNMSRLYSPTGKERKKRISLLREILALNSRYAPAYVELGMLHYGEKEYGTAQELFERAARENPLLVDARTGLGLVKLRQGQTGNAEQIFRELLRSDSLQPQNYFNLGRLYAEKDDYRTALKFYNKALKNAQGYYPEAWLNRGVVYERLEKPDSAVASYKQALEFDPDYEEAYYNLGLLYLTHGDDTKAATYFRKACDHRPDYAIAWYNLGVLYSRANRIDSAVISYRRAIDVQPDYLKARLNLAVNLAARGDTTQAIDEYTRITKDFPAYTAAWFNLARLHTAQKEYGKAVDAYLEMLKADPEDNRARQNMGVVYSRLGRDEDAVRVYRDALERDPGNAAIRFNLALHHRKVGRMAQAIVEFEKALSLKPDYEKAWNNLLSLYEETGTRLKGARFLAELWQNTEAIGPLAFDIGMLFYKAEDWVQASEWFQLATETYSRKHRAWYWLGRCHHRQGQHAEAAESYRKAAEIKGSYEYAWKRLGMVSLTLGDTTAALKALDSALTLRPDDRRVARTLERIEE